MNIKTFQLKIMFQEQQDSSSSGLYAIVFVVDNFGGISPTESHFMWKHLFECAQEKQFTVFQLNTSLNISTGHRTMFGKKSSYIRLKMLHNGHEVRYEVKKNSISYQRLKTQKYSVSTGLPCSGFSFY